VSRPARTRPKSPLPTGEVRTGRRVPFGRFVALILVLAGLVIGVRQLFFRGGDHEPTPTSRPGAVAATSPASSPQTTATAVTDPSGRPLPACQYGVLPAPHDGYADWNRTLLDTTYALPPSYAPTDLAPVWEAGFSGGELVRAFVVPDLEALRLAAAAAGRPVEVVAAYRSYVQQSALFAARVGDLGRKAALGKTARPGHSEHQLGTTIDFKTEGARDVASDWEQTPTGAWMAANAWRYGFVMSYPAGESSSTCYSYEPWHFRYFGRDLTARMQASGLSPREFLWESGGRIPPPAGKP
jgi:zinc D-Ala-D-Ala carboxypeptidase